MSLKFFQQFKKSLDLVQFDLFSFFSSLLFYFKQVTYGPHLLKAWNFGDPHITTTDGVTYTFNGLGEYHHIYSDAFSLQARTQKVKDENGTDSDATAFVAFAAQDSTSGVVREYLSSVT